MDGVRRSSLLHARYLILSLWGALLLALVLSQHGGEGGDWIYFRLGYGLLIHGRFDQLHRFTTTHYIGGGLHLYALQPKVQIGPLALIVGHFATILDHLNRYLAPVLTLLTGLYTLRHIERAAALVTTSRQRLERLTLTGGLLLIYGWVQAFIWWRHLDDMLVVVGTTIAATAVVRRRPWLLGSAVGLALTAKPTALVVVPLLFAIDRRSAAKSVATATLIASAAWLPFLMAAPRMVVMAGRAQVPVAMGSGLTALGFAVGDAPPDAIRIAQLLVALAAGAVAVRRGRWYLVPLLGFGIRSGLDPMTVSYYGVSVVFGAILADMFPRPQSPLKTIAAWLVFCEPFSLVSGYWPALSQPDQAWLRLSLPAVLAVVLLSRSTRADRSDSDTLPRMSSYESALVDAQER